MATTLTHPVTTSDVQQPPSLSPPQLFEVTRAREEGLSRLLMAFVTTGLIFMVLPGTFLGVWNLLQISGRESAGSISPAWLQAHGHAQVFGWIGSFILGIGFYSIPKLRGATKPAFGPAWACWAMWTIGVAVRWAANVYAWQWRLLLPLSGVLELAAFVIFFQRGFTAPARRFRQEPTGAVDLGGYQRKHRVDVNADCEPSGVLLSCVARRKPSIVAHSRPTLSGVGRMGIPGAVRLGIQYQIDNSVPWSQAGSSQAALVCAGGELCGRCFDARGMGG